MESQKMQSRPGWYLASLLLLVPLLVLPGLCLDTLLCYHCPLQHKGQPCAPEVRSTTRCLADERCASSRARYGILHVLSSQGCVAEALCGTHELLTYRDTRYNVSHTCCCADRCNLAPRPESALETLLGLIAQQHNLLQDDVNVGQLASNVIAEAPWDSCVNYTSPKGQTRVDVFDALSNDVTL